MANTTSTFVSPGLFFQTQDLSYVTQAIGITTLGLVGETLKGPAFSPVLISNSTNFMTTFGAQSTQTFANGIPQYELPYIANSYLTESNQLYVTRILGLSGYNAGKAWVITASAGINPATIGVSGTTTGNTTFTGNTFGNAIIEANVSNIVTLPITSINSATTFTVSSGATLVKSGTAFTATQISFTVTTFTGATSAGTINYNIKTITGTSLSAYEGLPLALIRPRASWVNEVLTFNTSNLSISSQAYTNPLAQFTLTSDNDSLLVSLDQTQSHYIGKVLGYGAQDNNVDIFVEDIYANQIAALTASGAIYGVNSALTLYTTLNNYKEQYQTPQTPWIVSELRGNQVQNLFYFISISDGNEANKDIKISIQNINFATGEFDVTIRDFNDSDSSVTILENFSKCTMNPLLTSFIGNRIGTADMQYELISNYVMVQMAPNAPTDALPCGFQGYTAKNINKLPLMLYKTGYTATDKVKKVFLGISDTVGIDQDIFNYQGVNISTGITAGFHMDSGVTGNYITGAYSFVSEASVANTPLSPLSARKFTLAPAGGFDGWDIYRTIRTNSDDFQNSDPKFSGFTLANPSDYYAYLNGINTFADASDIYINLIATPGIDYDNQTSLVNEAIDMVENRGDCFYIVTTPDVSIGDTTFAQDAVDTLAASGIDSTYTTTFFPWVQYKDTQNNANIFLPPTYEYVRLAAQTDNQYAPWFAVAGYNRGQLLATKTEYKVNQDSADILYEGRINPIRSYPNSPLMIFGNKNLQIANSALNRSNVVRLLLQIQKLIANVAVRLIFEPNDTTLQTQFLNLANPILAQVQKQRGVIAFQVTCDSTNNTSQTMDQLELVGNILIKPTLAAEFISVTFGVTDQGATFSAS